jgi:hypothetical protein
MYLRKKRKNLAPVVESQLAKHLHGGLWEIEKFLSFLVTTVHYVLHANYM